MKSPANFLAALPQIVKQKANMDIVAVEVVQPDDIRVIAADPLQKSPGGGFGAKAPGAEQPVPQGVD